MASELASSQQRLERSRARSGAQEPRGRRAAALSRDHPRAHRHRRRLLRRAGPRQHRQPGGAAAARARRGRARQAAATVFARDDLRPLAALAGASGGPGRAAGRGRAVGTPDRRRGRGGAARHRGAARSGARARRPGAAPARRDDDARRRRRRAETVLVVDDVTPLMRAQKVAAWRDVARRLAHEIKNPLTPIQLSAERLQRHFADAPEPTRRLVDECSTAIVAEVESLKSLVDEFSQFARMPAPKAVPTDLNALLADALALYTGLLDARDDRAAAGARSAARPARSGAVPARGHQPRRQRHRGAERGARDGPDEPGRRRA